MQIPIIAIYFQNYWLSIKRVSYYFHFQCHSRLIVLKVNLHQTWPEKCNQPRNWKNYFDFCRWWNLSLVSHNKFHSLNFFHYNPYIINNYTQKPLKHILWSYHTCPILNHYQQRLQTSQRKLSWPNYYNNNKCSPFSCLPLLFSVPIIFFSFITFFPFTFPSNTLFFLRWHHTVGTLCSESI